MGKRCAKKAMSLTGTPTAKSSAMDLTKPARRATSKRTLLVNPLAQFPKKTCLSCFQNTHMIDKDSPLDKPEYLVWSKTSYVEARGSSRDERKKTKQRRLCGNECYRCGDLRRTNLGNPSQQELIAMRKENAELDAKCIHMRRLKFTGGLTEDRKKLDVSSYKTKQERSTFDQFFEEGEWQELWQFCEQHRIKVNRHQHTQEDAVEAIKEQFPHYEFDYDNSNTFGVLIPDQCAGRKRYRRGVDARATQERAEKHDTADAAEETYLAKAGILGHTASHASISTLAQDDDGGDDGDECSEGSDPTQAEHGSDEGDDCTQASDVEDDFERATHRSDVGSLHSASSAAAPGCSRRKANAASSSLNAKLLQKLASMKNGAQRAAAAKGAALARADSSDRDSGLQSATESPTTLEWAAARSAASSAEGSARSAATRGKRQAIMSPKKSQAAADAGVTEDGTESSKAAKTMREGET